MAAGHLAAPWFMRGYTSSSRLTFPMVCFHADSCPTPLYSFNNRRHRMMIRKPDRLIRRSSWPPGTCLPPVLGEYRYSPIGKQFCLHDTTQTHDPYYSIHSTKGGTGWFFVTYSPYLTTHPRSFPARKYKAHFKYHSLITTNKTAHYM